MFKKIYLDKISFERKTVIDKKKQDFKMSFLLPINLYLKDNFLTSF